jgi:uncharacterized protein (TIGR00369 family)
MTAPPDDPAHVDPVPAAAQRFIAALPHSRALAMSVETVGEGRAVLSMPWAEHLVGDPRTGVIHGGAVSALMDTAGGAAVLGHPDVKGSTATMDLRIDYMRPATTGQRITAEAVCHTVTRSVAFVRAEARDEDGVVAQAHGAFTVDRPA